MVLYFSTEDGMQYSLFCNFDWLEDYVKKSGVDDIGDFLENYTSKDVMEIMNALDLDNQPYTVQEEHQFSGFAD